MSRWNKSTDAMSTDAMSTDAMSTDEPSFTQSPSPTRQSSSTVQPSFTQNHDGRSSPVMSSSAYETQSTVSGTNIVPLKLSSGKGSPTAYITVLH
uniref:Uncharacterized protein n=1 Tax=Ditylenchus dipsaci TaxID=166011 RepID=A0A915DKA9_9BILA